MANDNDVIEIKESIVSINRNIEKVLEMEARLTRVEKYINILDEDIKIISKFVNEIHQNLDSVFGYIGDLSISIVKGFNKIFDMFQ
ncbi:MAG: hypothetical protein HEQ19_14000 [Gloeotrichia echinulata CP02]|jgi:hypothetical protein|nr:hypothetical protein [Gloeotrichia echinulata DEX184]